jgi:hypothetical protein
MANKTLFASLRDALIPPTDTVNSENAPAYALTPTQLLAQYAATGCFERTFYATGASGTSWVSVPFAKGIALSGLHIIPISKILAIRGMRVSSQILESHKSLTDLREITRRPRSNWRIRTPRTSLGRACDPVVLR